MLKKTEIQVAQADAGSREPVRSAFSAHESTARARLKESAWIDKFLDKKKALQAALPPQPAPQPAPQAVVPAPLEPPALSVERLLALPAPLAAQLAALERADSRANTVPASLLHEIWIAIESNTSALVPEWAFIESTGRGPADALAAAAGGAGELVLARFPDILAPHQTAITDGVRSARHGVRHYLHANRVDLQCGLTLIASQKPLAAEIPGFQQMLAEQNVALVVDLTRDVEQDVQDDYALPRPMSMLKAATQRRIDLLPSRRAVGSELKAMLQVLTVRYAAREHAARDHAVQRLHFSAWPDHGVVSEDTLIALADRVGQLSHDSGGAVVIHCMAGVGRSGTLLSFIAARRRIAAMIRVGQPVGVAAVLRTAMDVVARGRIDRSPSFVQTEEQFQLLVQALFQDSAQASGATDKHLVGALPLPRSAWQRAMRWLGVM